MLSTHLNPLGESLTLNLLVYNVSSMLGNTGDSPVLPWSYLCVFLFAQSYSLDVYYITLFVDLHVCIQRNDSMFSERAIPASPPLCLCACHFGKSREDGVSCQNSPLPFTDRNTNATVLRCELKAVMLSLEVILASVSVLQH